MAVVTFTMHRTPVTLLGIHGEYAGLEPARVTPRAANDNLTQLTGHGTPLLHGYQRYALFQQLNTPISFLYSGIQLAVFLG